MQSRVNFLFNVIKKNVHSIHHYCAFIFKKEKPFFQISQIYNNNARCEQKQVDIKTNS